MTDEDDVWYLPRMGRKHWGLVLFLVILQFIQNPMSIAGLLGTLVGAVVLVYALLIVWSGLNR